MKASVEQRALLALDLLLTRNLSMTKATKLALTTPKTFKKYLKQKGIRWVMKRNRFTVVRTPEQKVYEFFYYGEYTLLSYHQHIKYVKPPL